MNIAAALNKHDREAMHRFYINKINSSKSMKEALEWRERLDKFFEQFLEAVTDGRIKD